MFQYRKVLLPCIHDSVLITEPVISKQVHNGKNKACNAHIAHINGILYMFLDV